MYAHVAVAAGGKGRRRVKKPAESGETVVEGATHRSVVPGMADEWKQRRRLGRAVRSCAGVTGPCWGGEVDREAVF